MKDEEDRTGRSARLRRIALAFALALVGVTAVAGVWTLIAGASQWSGLWTTHSSRIGSLTIRIERAGSGYVVVPYNGRRLAVARRADRATLRRSDELKLAAGLFGRHARLILAPDHVTLRLIVGRGHHRWSARFAWTTAPTKYRPSRPAIRTGRVLQPLLVRAG